MLRTAYTRHDRLLDSLFGNNWSARRPAHMRAQLSANTENNAYRIQREEGRCTIVVPLPGAKREDINVSLDGNILAISCESELGFGFEDFNATFRTTEGTSESHIQATCEDGILRVVVKEPEVQITTKQIPVN